ncbi:hypothetical protein RHMOL_Rhmol02G0263000 [Rhododendron molle]|uniref:Uncharacterized protein n=1 Tax=Rhododendron molle TaxID=49168 RepID=A0ACC0PVR4_RHOML|nr:hypothetical protein RHMOL_Rhmol02G0263000 [Rhododendron molle]
MNKENAALVIQIDEERALKQDTMEKLNSIIEKRDKEVKAIAYKIHTTELDELTKAQAEFNKLKREYREQILLRDGKIKMLEEQMAAPVRPEPQMAALVASEAQQTTNDEHKEHSDDQKKEMEAIDFIPTEYRVMVTTILKDESRILVWAGEELDNYVYDDDFRFLMLDDALTCGVKMNMLFYFH